MIDHVRNSQGVELDQVEVLILDEADRLLEMGFTDEVTELVKFCPIGRQTLLFSATMTDKVDELVKLSLNKPVRIRVNSADHVVDRLVQEFIRIRENREGDREAILLALVTRNFKKQTIIFFEEKVQCHRLAIVFGLAGLSCGELHGNMTQRQRLESLQQFKDGTVDYLLCTELAARGLDVKGCSTVINFFMPREMSRYIHRVGRTARAGRAGKAVTLVGERGRPLLREIVKNSSANIKSRTVPVEVVRSRYSLLASSDCFVPYRRFKSGGRGLKTWRPLSMKYMRQRERRRCFVWQTWKPPRLRTSLYMQMRLRPDLLGHGSNLRKRRRW